MVGKILDGATSDASNMGAAMAPAAADTLITYFKETGRRPADFDAIYTGDLGAVGTALLHELVEAEGYSLSGVHRDCGLLLYDKEKQDVHSGASGCGCSASVLAASVLPAIQRGELSHVLFLSTGALMSPTSVQQGQNIYGIAPLIHLAGKRKAGVIQ
jgi:stage V sporulation protein AD